MQLRAGGGDEKITSKISYSTTGEKQRKTVETYNVANQLMQSEVSYWDSANNDWRQNQRNIYAYDAAGNQILDEGYFNSFNIEYGYKWKPNQKFVYAYDDAKHQILKEEYEGEGDKWLQVQKTVLAYDAAGHKILDERYGEGGYEGDDWLKIEKTEALYEEEIQTLSVTYKGGEGNQWVGSSSKQTYDYDNGVLIAESEYAWQNNGWYLFREFIYDNKGQTGKDKVYATTITHTYPGNYVGKGIGIHIPAYRMRDIRHLTLQNGSESDDVEFEYESIDDEYGNLAKVDVFSVREENGQEVKTLAYRYKIEYENNLPVSIEAYEGGSNELKVKIIRDYDERGNMTLDELWGWSSEKNLLVPDDKTIYAYDTNDNQILIEKYQNS
jgi:hypothetical protein